MPQLEDMIIVGDARIHLKATPIIIPADRHRAREDRAYIRRKTWALDILIVEAQKDHINIADEDLTWEAEVVRLAEPRPTFNAHPRNGVRLTAYLGKGTFKRTFWHRHHSGRK